MLLHRAHSSLKISSTALRKVAHNASRWHSTSISKPLRILFCGSDEFSCASLQALYNEHVRNSEAIASIDVMCRPGKPSGRGLKNIRNVPIKKLACQLGLPIHERDTFTGWSIPTRDGHAINLLIAVSFGLLVPSRILDAVDYGGLNVHPSLLPDLRGPAPLVHALLNGNRQTGITLQSLHPTKFDHGRILLQQAFQVPNPDSCTYSEILSEATKLGPGILVDGIRKGAYLPNYILPSPPSAQLVAGTPRHAPKITNRDREVDFQSFSIQQILRRDRVLGRLWCNVKTAQGVNKRLVLSELSCTELSDSTGTSSLAIYSPDSMPTTIQVRRIADKPNVVVLSGWAGAEKDIGLVVGSITVEGGKKVDSGTALYDRNGALRFTGVPETI